MKENVRESLRVLNSREKKPIVKAINEQWGSDFNPDVLLMSNKNKLFVMDRGIEQLDWSQFRVDKAGLYIGKHEKEIRLSIEGSQIVGKSAKDNILDVSDEETKLWFQGKDIERDEADLAHLSGYIILKNRDDFLGSGKMMKDKILNFVPKGRRVNLSNR